MRECRYLVLVCFMFVVDLVSSSEYKRQQNVTFAKPYVSMCSTIHATTRTILSIDGEKNEEKNTIKMLVKLATSVFESVFFFLLRINNKV